MIRTPHGAMSSALGRLRHVLQDDVRVRTPTGMEPTPRARELWESIRQILRHTERVLTQTTVFTASTSQRTLRQSAIRPHRGRTPQAKGPALSEGCRPPVPLVVWDMFGLRVMGLLGRGEHMQDMLPARWITKGGRDDAGATTVTIHHLRV